MLERLLRLAAARGSSEAGTLARELGAGPRQTAEMLETLARQGYLERIVAGCDLPCERCPLHSFCPRESGARLWRLTPKAARFLGRRPA